MTLVDVLTKNKIEETLISRVYGVVIGIVTNINDPDDLGRVKVKFPWLKENQESQWARVMSFMAGNERGGVFRPEVDDEVLVLFEHGDTRYPYVIGALWNGKDKIPSERGSDSDNNVRLIKSRSGHLIVLDDTDGSEKIELIDKGGENKLTIDTIEETITISSSKDIKLSAPSGKIVLETGELELTATSTAKLEAASDMEIKTDATVTIKGSTVNIN